MSLLKEISISVQQVAEAISIAIGIEVEIVDENLTVIGGTGIYRKLVGQKEEAGRLDGNYLYARVLRKGKTEAIADAQRDEEYGLSQGVPQNLAEVAEICTPIKLGEKTLGVIGLIAFNEEQKEILMDKDRDMTSFVEKMAELLAAKATQQLAFRHAEMSKMEMMTIIESTHEGVIAIDRGGYIKHCNKVVASLFGVDKSEMTGTHLNQYMLGSPALNIIKTGKGYTEKEERYRIGRGGIHLIVTAKPFFTKGMVGGVVISMRDIQEAQLLAYKMEKGAIKKNLEDIVGESAAIKKIKSQAQLLARGDSSILINGGKGVGKGFLGRALHYSGPRAEQIFSVVDCIAVPEELICKEIMEKLQISEGGSLLIEEIGKLTIKAQAKLLEVIRTMKGEGQTIKGISDVRIIATSTEDIKELIKEERFLEELYYKIAVIPINMPLLRDRGEEDIICYMEHFLEKYNRLAERNVKGFSDEAKLIYTQYSWPGNIQELENAIEYGVNMCRKDYIEAKHIPANIAVLKEEDKKEELLAEQVKAFEREIIIKELIRNGGSKTVVAKKLGLSTATMYRKLTELDINTKLI